MVLLSLLTAILPGIIFYLAVKPSFRVRGVKQAAEFLADKELSSAATPKQRKQTYISIAGMFHERLKMTQTRTRAGGTTSFYQDHAEILSAACAA
jgi:hypothetical protein